MEHRECTKNAKVLLISIFACFFYHPVVAGAKILDVVLTSF
jgi:hypothetical protein